tara:strand:- start:5697 stop:6293 length:597 start_codon:yes stop_codon:yes gene_type:complete
MIKDYNNYDRAWLRHYMLSLFTQNINVSIPSVNLDTQSKLLARNISGSASYIRATQTRTKQGSHALCHEDHFERRSFLILLEQLPQDAKTWVSAIYQQSGNKKNEVQQVVQSMIQNCPSITEKTYPKHHKLYSYTLVNYTTYYLMDEKVVFNYKQIAQALCMSERAFYKTWHSRYQDAFEFLEKQDTQVLNMILECMA